MKIAIVGSTSRTGLHLLAKATQRGHTLTAFTRRPAELPPLPTAPAVVAVVEGDGTRVEDLRRLVRGQDAVISIVAAPDLGPSRVVSRVTLALIEAMRAEGVRRVITTSSRSLGATQPAFGLGLLWAFMHHIYADGVRAETYVEQSGLDWTIARATRLVDGVGVCSYHADFEPNPTGGSMTLKRGDYAEALLDIAETPSLTARIVGINGPGSKPTPHLLKHLKPPEPRVLPVEAAK